MKCCRARRQSGAVPPINGVLPSSSCVWESFRNKPWLHQLRSLGRGEQTHSLQPQGGRKHSIAIAMATQQSLPQSLSGISAICGNWIAFPKDQHSSTPCTFCGCFSLLSLTPIKKARVDTCPPLMLTTFHDSSPGMPPSEAIHRRTEPSNFHSHVFTGHHVKDH